MIVSGNVTLTRRLLGLDVGLVLLPREAIVFLIGILPYSGVPVVCSTVKHITKDEARDPKH